MGGRTEGTSGSGAARKGATRHDGLIALLADRMPRQTSTPLDALWQAPVIAWVVLAGEALAAVLALAPGVVGDRWFHFGLTSLVIQWVALFTLGGLYALRRPLARVRPPYLAYFALGLLMLATWLVCGLAWLTAGEALPLSAAGWRSLLLRLSGIALTVGLLGLAIFQNHWRARQLAVRAKQFELEALQARIRPHFLFNTLNTGAALVHQRPDQAEHLLLDLADLFRAALAGPREIPLGDELTLARRYLEIEGLRFGPRLRVNWRLPERLPPVMVPTLSIQPLVENAIRHGVEPAAGGGEIDIEVESGADAVRVVVRNTMPAQAGADTSGHRIGLDSVRARLQSMAGSSLETGVVEGRYVATLRIAAGDT